MSSLPKCNFNYDTLIARVGNQYKGYKDVQCIKVPAFTKEVYEEECLGGGWYGNKVKVTRKLDCYYLLIEDSQVTGVLIDPYYQESIKSDIHPIDFKHLPKEVKDFIRTFNT